MWLVSDVPVNVPFDLASFSFENLLNALALAPCTAHDVGQGDVSRYLADYLTALGVKTILTELSYVDADYLDDYANFYAKSFERIPNRCRRLHFFTVEIASKEDFLALILASPTADCLQENYAGFVVARPLPTAAIGRTVLKTYPPDGGRRNYPTVRCYQVNLFGMSLIVNSLAFQMQDTSLAACATVALWTCFQKTQDIFKSLSPTPVAITRAATQFLFSARPFPSRGLQVQQICNAIASVGLDPEVYPVGPTLPLSSLIYSYLRLGLPVLLLVKVPGTGGHAVALTGYSLRKDEQLASEGGQVRTLLPRMVGTRIDEFYGHDDQKGPFRRFVMEPPIDDQSVVTFKDTGWQVNLVPEFVIVPVYPKIRTGFREVTKFLPTVSIVAGWAANPLLFEWDVFLTSGNEFKASLREGTTLEPSLKEALLLDAYPKYLWRCILRLDGVPFLEMLLDTTAMVAGFPIRHLWWHDTSARDVVKAFVGVHENFLKDAYGPRLIEILKSAY